MCDLLWSDPDSKLAHGWRKNDKEVSLVFSEEVVRQFLKKHDLDLIVRGRQVVENGYEFFAGQSLVTVFSAPNYRGEFDNAGAIMIADENLLCSFKASLFPSLYP